jgi:YidC/Oxa1 family membrane protein insertase
MMREKRAEKEGGFTAKEQKVLPPKAKGKRK